MAEKTKDVRSWAIEAGFSEKEAKVIQNFYNFAETGKRPPKKEFDTWKKIGFIQKDSVVSISQFLMMT